MTALALLQQLHELDVALEPYLAGTLRYKAPKGVLTPTLREALSEHKAALHALVEAFEERAAILEYDGRIPRDEAERLAWACIQRARDVGAVCIARRWRSVYGALICGTCHPLADQALVARWEEG